MLHLSDEEIAKIPHTSRYFAKCLYRIGKSEKYIFNQIKKNASLEGIYRKSLGWAASGAKSQNNKYDFVKKCMERHKGNNAEKVLSIVDTYYAVTATEKV